MVKRKLLVSRGTDSFIPAPLDSETPRMIAEDDAFGDRASNGEGQRAPSREDNGERPGK
jgi:hypothetical protein